MTLHYVTLHYLSARALLFCFLMIQHKEATKLTAATMSFNVPNTPGGTCFPGIPVNLTAAFFVEPAMSTRISSKKSKSWTAVKASPAPLDARWDLACGVVMMGRERRREDSTSASKWSLMGVSVMRVKRVLPICYEGVGWGWGMKGRYG